MANIDFITFLTKHSLEYANFLRLTGESLKSGQHNIKWKCVLSNQAKIVPENFECINRVSFNNKNSSLRHGLTINSTLSKIDSDYVIISDADVAMTYKDWDNEIVKILDKGYSCFGSMNVKRSREPMNFPNTPFFCFKKEIMEKIQLDFTPVMENNDIRRIIIETEQEAKKFEREIGETVIFNTGCRLAKSFMENGLTPICLQPVIITSEQIQLQFENIQEKNSIVTDENPTHNLVEYHYDGCVFMTHLGRSRKSSFKKGFVQNWVDRIKRYIRKEYKIDILPEYKNE